MLNSKSILFLFILTPFILILLSLNLYAQGKTNLTFDPDDPPETTIPIAPYLTFGAQVDLEYNFFGNIDPENEIEKNLSILEPGLTLAFSFDPTRHIQAFLETSISRQITFTDGDKGEDNLKLEIEQGYLLFKELFDDRLSIQLGRQRFEDEREWLYDEDLDAIRLIYDISDISLELSASRLNIVDRDLLNSDEKERIYNYGFYANYETEHEEKEKILGAYAFLRDDRSQDNESPIFLGIQGEGDLTENLEYWLDTAFVFGESGDNDIRAFGFDIGSIYQFDLPFEPSVTLSYAFGSGDSNPEDGTDSNFRQSGLQSNEGSFNGAADFKYYGEIFDPELSNIHILSAGFGINPTEQSSIDIVYHYYRQHRAADFIRDSALNTDPNGTTKDIGNEFDLVLGYERIRTPKLEAALKLGYLLPGEAFASNSENIFLVKFEIQYEF